MNQTCLYKENRHLMEKIFQKYIYIYIVNIYFKTVIVYVNVYYCMQNHFKIKYLMEKKLRF